MAIDVSPRLGYTFFGVVQLVLYNDSSDRSSTVGDVAAIRREIGRIRCAQTLIRPLKEPRALECLHIGDREIEQREVKRRLLFLLVVARSPPRAWRPRRQACFERR